MSKLGNRGDTIVEVMISLAVISFIVVLAYGTASRSLKQSRQSQERVEAVKILESQMERIRASSSSPSFLPDSNGFCFDASNDVVKSDSVYTTSVCKFNNLYKVTVKRVDNLYTATVVWDNATGTGQDRAEMYYRIY